jgi:hypothetical protein
MHAVVTSHEAAIRKVEKLVDPVVDLRLLKALLHHFGGVLVALVFIPRVNPPLARLHSAADKAPDHNRFIQTRPLNPVHQLLNLSGVL